MLLVCLKHGATVLSCSEKYIHVNDGSFMMKPMSKENIHRTKLRNRYNDDRTEDNFKAYKKQRNKCVKLLCKVKFDNYVDINLNNVSDKHMFYRTVKPLYSDKVQVNSSISLLEDRKIVSKDSEIAKMCNNVLANIT